MKIELSDIRKYQNIEFLARQMVEGFITGLHRSPYHGFSVEFAEHRLYNTGESTRHIDWKVYAKTDKLFTKRYEEETNLRAQILIDVSSSMFYPTENLGKITFSIMAAAAIINMLQRQKDAVGITTFSDAIEFQSPIKSTSTHVHTLFLKLQQLLQEKGEYKKTSAATVLHHIAEKMNRRSLVIVFSDMFENAGEKDEIFKALQHLKHNHHEVLLFHVMDKKTEEMFEFGERPIEFIDIESGEKVKVMPSQVREKYLEAVKSLIHDIKLKSTQYKIDYIPADISEGFDQILSAYLIKRAKV